MSTIAVATTNTDPRIAWFAHECERNGVRIETRLQSAEHAGDRDMAAFFRRAQREAHKTEDHTDHQIGDQLPSTAKTASPHASRILTKLRVANRAERAAAVDGRSVTAATRDNDLGMIWFVEECLRNGVRPESCIRLAENAGDPELAAFFHQARRASHAIMARTKP
jgi:hypothetical protein